MSGRRGVTLLEMLIAVVLVSMLSVGMLMAMRTATQAYERANDRLMSNRRVAAAQLILERQIAGVIPTTTACPGTPLRVPFFQGSRGLPRLVEFQVIPGERGGFRLISNEYLYSGPASLLGLCVGLVADPLLNMQRPLFRPVGAGPRSFVVADNLMSAQFFYRRLSNDGTEARWLPNWAGDVLPTAVRVQLNPVTVDAARLPLTSVTVPIRVTRQPAGPYQDVQQ
jgi:general secretion pathway protein J